MFGLMPADRLNKQTKSGHLDLIKLISKAARQRAIR